MVGLPGLRVPLEGVGAFGTTGADDLETLLEALLFVDPLLIVVSCSLVSTVR